MSDMAGGVPVDEDNSFTLDLPASGGRQSAEAAAGPLSPVN